MSGFGVEKLLSEKLSETRFLKVQKREPPQRSLNSGKSIKIWDIRSGLCKKILCSHGSGVGSVAFSPNGKIIASGSGDATVKIWGIRE